MGDSSEEKGAQENHQVFKEDFLQAWAHTIPIVRKTGRQAEDQLA